MRYNLRLLNYLIIPVFCVLFIFLNWSGAYIKLGLLSYFALLAIAAYIISDHFYDFLLNKKIDFFMENNHRLFIFYGFIFAITHTILIWQRYYGLFFHKFLDFSSWPAFFINCWIFGLIFMAVLVISDILSQNGWLEEHLPVVWRTLSWLVFIQAFGYCYFMTDSLPEKILVVLVPGLVLFIALIRLLQQKFIRE